MDSKENKLRMHNIHLPFIAVVLLGIISVLAFRKATSGMYNLSAGFSESKIVGSFLAMLLIIFFTELNIHSKTRMTISCLLGMTAIGIFLWPMAAPVTELDSLCMLNGTISLLSASLIIICAFLAGIVGYAIGWPSPGIYGNLSVLTGFGMWSLRTAPVSSILTQNDSLEGFKLIYTSFRWEIFFWLAVVMAGNFGSRIASKILTESQPEKTTNHTLKWTDKAFIIPLGVSSIIGFVVASILIIGVQVPFNKIGVLTLQPTSQQIAFGLIVAFGISGFVVKKYFYTAIEMVYLSVAVTAFFCYVLLAKQNNLEVLEKLFSPNYFLSPMTAILPIQFIIFGCLGGWIGWFAGSMPAKNKDNSNKR